MKEFKLRNKTYLLERGTHCFNLSVKKYNEKKKEDYLDPIGYYNNLEAVFLALFNVHVLDNDETKSLIDCVRETREEIRLTLGALS